VDVEAIMRRVDEDLAEAQAHLRAAQGRVDELTTLRDGFRMAVQRYAPAAAKAVSISDVAGPVTDSVRVEVRPRVNLGQAVEKTLEEFGRPASTREVYEQVGRMGRAETYEQVRSSLHYLESRQHRVAKAGRGLWELPVPVGVSQNGLTYVGDGRAKLPEVAVDE
jgi:hypothetical protein